MHSSSALVSCEINFPGFFWCVFMVRFSITDPEGNFSFNLSWDSLVDWFIDCFRHVLTFLYFLCVTFFLILVKCFLNILAVVYFDFYAFISSFPLFVFTVLETFWFGVISTNPLLLTFVFITFLTFSNVIRIGDLKRKNKNIRIIHLSYQRNQIALEFYHLAYYLTNWAISC